MEEAQRKKQRQDGSDSGSAPCSISPSGAGRDKTRVSWRDVPDFPLSIIAELVGMRVCSKLSEAQAVQAVLPAALTSLKVNSDSLDGLAVALSDVDGAPQADGPGVMQALATQQACSEIALGLRPGCFDTPTCIALGNALGTALASENSTLRKLCIEGDLGDAGGAALAAGLQHNKMLQHLKLWRCNIGIETCRALGAALAFENSALCGLNLCGNMFMGDAGGAALAEGLARNSTLRRIDLSHSGVGVATCRALSAAVAFEGSALSELDLSFNRDVGNAGGAALGESLPGNSTLAWLSLDCCGVELWGCPTLAQVLRNGEWALGTMDSRSPRMPLIFKRKAQATQPHT